MRLRLRLRLHLPAAVALWSVSTSVHVQLWLQPSLQQILILQIETLFSQLLFGSAAFALSSFPAPCCSNEGATGVAMRAPVFGAVAPVLLFTVEALYHWELVPLLPNPKPRTSIYF